MCSDENNINDIDDDYDDVCIEYAETSRLKIGLVWLFKAHFPLNYPAQILAVNLEFSARIWAG